MIRAVHLYEVTCDLCGMRRRVERIAPADDPLLPEGWTADKEWRWHRCDKCSFGEKETAGETTAP